MKTSRPLYYYPAQLSDPEAEWAYQRLWQLLIPVFMGVMHRLAGPLGPSVGVLVMIVAHAATHRWEPPLSPPRAQRRRHRGLRG